MSKATAYAQQRPRPLHLPQEDGSTSVMFAVDPDAGGGLRVDNLGPFKPRHVARLQAWLSETYDAATATQRLKAIAAILEGVDARAMSADGPVTPTSREITDAELREIYLLATGKRSARGIRRRGRR